MARTGARRGLRALQILSENPASASDTVSGTGHERARALEPERQSLAAILGLLRTGRAFTRLDLEREARLGRAVVTDRLATLTGFGLIDESGLGRSIGGRAPRLIRFRPDAGRILVANVDRDTIGVGLADLSGHLIAEHFEDVEVGGSPEALLERLDTLFEWCLDRHDSPPLWGIGLGLPGPIEQVAGAPFEIPKLEVSPAWQGAVLIERLIQRFRAPVWVRSAVQVTTMGEIGSLDGPQSHDLLYVDLGTDISAGFVSGGRLHRGAWGVAGQIGHVYAGEPHTTVCRCGNIGCLQTAAGCEAIGREGLHAAEGGRSPILADILAQTGAVTVADIGTAARLGDLFAADLLARSGRLIGTILAALVNVLNPSTIVVGGELAQAGDICLAAIREGVYRHAQPLATRDLGIVRSRMGRSSGLAGAAKVAVDEIFSPVFLEAWIPVGSPLVHPKMLELLNQTGRVTQDRETPVAAGSGRAPSAGDPR